jgi:hypothetical protein
MGDRPEQTDFLLRPQAPPKGDAPVGSGVADGLKKKPPKKTGPDAVVHPAGLTAGDLETLALRAEQAEAAAQEDDFKWAPENEDVVVAEQRATAVYVNTWQQAVIRQERAWNDEDDTFICVGFDALPAVIERLRSIYAELQARREEESKARGRRK